MVNSPPSSPSIQADHFYLREYIFTEQKVLANPFFDENNGEITDLEIIININDNAKEDGIFYIQVNISTGSDQPPEEKTHCSYQFSISAFGRIELDLDDIKIEDIDLHGKDISYHAGITGAQILIGAIRERVADLTARGPWPTILIQTVGINFLKNEVIRALENDSEENQKKGT